MARELLLAAGAEEAVLVPWLLTVGHPAGGDWLMGARVKNNFSDLK